MCERDIGEHLNERILRREREREKERGIERVRGEREAGKEKRVQIQQPPYAGQICELPESMH